GGLILDSKITFNVCSLLLKLKICIMNYSNSCYLKIKSCLFMCMILLSSCKEYPNDFIKANSTLFSVDKSEAEIKTYIDGLNWEKHVILRTRSDKCYTCVAEDVLGGVEGCGIGAWLGGPIGCSIAGALVASYRSIREANATGFSKDKGPW